MLFAHMGMEHSSPKIMMSFNLSFLEIILRLSMATIFAAIMAWIGKNIIIQLVLERISWYA